MRTRGERARAGDTSEQRSPPWPRVGSRSEYQKRIMMNMSDHSETTFSYRAPDALSVAIIGDFTHWQRQPVNLHRHADGLWQTTLRLTPGSHHYTFLIDGKWRDDAEYNLQVRRPRQIVMVCGEA